MPHGRVLAAREDLLVVHVLLSLGLDDLQPFIVAPQLLVVRAETASVRVLLAACRALLCFVFVVLCCLRLLLQQDKQTTKQDRDFYLRPLLQQDKQLATSTTTRLLQKTDRAAFSKRPR